MPLLAFFPALWLAAPFACGQQAYRPPTPLGLDEYYPVPKGNPLTREAVDLGRRLFLDKRLSADRTLACASCHDPNRAFTDGRTVSVGVRGRTGTRNVPTLLNRAYGQSFFWDGRTTTLEEQVLRPIQGRLEMDLSLETLVTRLKNEREYKGAFRRAFGDEISSVNAARALASFVRTLRSGNSPYDRYQMGQGDALSASARRGLSLFLGKANCQLCHVGPTLTDEQFHNTGVAWRDGKLQDVGRFAVTDQEPDRGAFKTPTLRDVALTAPYMHDGSIPTLEKAIERYSKGGIKNPYLDAEIRPLELTSDEKRDLVAFLEALTGDDVRR